MILHECLLYCSWFHCVRSRWNMPVYNVLRIMRPHLSEASRAKLHFGHFSIYLMSLSMSVSLSNLLNVTFREMDLSGWFAGPCFVSVRLYHLLSLAIPTRQIDEHLQKWQPPKKTNSTILVFDLAKIFRRNCCNRYDLYRGLSFGGKNYCPGASRRFTSIRTLSDDECHKFRAIISTTCPQSLGDQQRKSFQNFLTTSQFSC